MRMGVMVTYYAMVSLQMCFLNKSSQGKNLVLQGLLYIASSYVAYNYFIIEITILSLKRYHNHTPVHTLVSLATPSRSTAPDYQYIIIHIQYTQGSSLAG